MTKEEHSALKTQMQIAAGTETIDRVMVDLGLDAIVGTMESEIVGLASLAGMFFSSANLLPTLIYGKGYPCATMPLGVYKKSGRPFGFCLIAGKHEAGKLLRIMAAYEASFPPRALPSLIS
jgi:amidase